MLILDTHIPHVSNPEPRPSLRAQRSARGVKLQLMDIALLKALRFHAGTGAGRTIGIGLNVKAIRKAPRPMIHEPT
jgi:hypothetical protein